MSEINGNPGSGLNGGIIGQSPEMHRLRRIIERTASSRHPVLVLGEKGTGKRSLARIIHLSGALNGQPFVEIDCASTPPAVLESRLFGLASSSVMDQPALATRGTLFLDSVGDMPLSIQGKLFRSLQEKGIPPAGGGNPVPVTARVIAATPRDLEPAVQQGAFRRDLYLRLNVVALRLPPLRDRKNDIPEIVENILRGFSRETGRQYSLASDTMKLLLAYDWPGNIGELQKALRHAIALSNSAVLSPAHLPPEIQASGALSDQASAPDSCRIVPLAEVERKVILDTLHQLNGNKQMAAQLLGIGKTTLYRKLKEYGIGRRPLDRSLGQ